MGGDQAKNDQLHKTSEHIEPIELAFFNYQFALNINSIDDAKKSVRRPKNLFFFFFFGN